MEPRLEPTSSGEARRPLDVPFEHLDLPAVGGHIGPDPEDFAVDELPLYAASGQGDHWYVRLGKRARTTLDLRTELARVSGAPEREIGYAGLKDKHAVTTQWFSVPVARTEPPERWALAPPFTLLEVARHTNKLRVGHSAGNRFRIRLVDVAAAARSALEPLAARIAAQGIGNYFGSQRFGHGQKNLETALWSLSRGRLGPRAGQRGKFLASVIQSEIYNRYLALRSELGRERLLAGEVVRLEGSRALFLVEDAEREAPRLMARDIHLTGPLVGPKMKESLGQPRELELAAIAALGLDARALAALGRAAPGTRRDLVLRPEAFSSRVEDDGSLITEFNLPSGAYASLVMRALTRQDPWHPSRAESGDRDAAGNAEESETEASD